MKGMQKINSQFYVDMSKELGKGNFGVVYKGYMLSENKIIAVKHMDQKMLSKNPDYERQIAVMQDLAKINHPNIMGYYGYEKNKKDGLYCFVQFCAGGSLKDLTKKKVSELKVMVLMRQLFEAMSYINKLNKVHRDLKPDNILLDEHMQLKIADFGLARDVQVLMTKGACTPLFAAPQVFNLQTYDQKCDVWSAGLILYQMLTGKQMFKHVKTKAQLGEELNKFKKGGRKVQYPKQLHPNWGILTEKMLTHDKKQRPSFAQLLKYFNQIYDSMQKDLNNKYGFEEGEVDIRTSVMRSKKINPYQSGKKDQNVDPVKKLKEQTSFNNFNNAQKYLLFFRMKTDFMNKIIKAFTSNTYAVMKNVYKYIMMFLSVSCYISKLSQNLVELKNKEVNTPDGKITAKDLEQVHLVEWQNLISEFKNKHISNIEKFRSVLEKQIVSKITSSYLKRDEEKKILNSYKNLLTWIEQTGKGNFMKHKFYEDMFIEVMNEKECKCNEHQLKGMSESDVKTYSYIRLTGHLNNFFPDKQYKNEDYIRIRRQELENMSKQELIDFLAKYN